jgi:hypothetical protein
MGKVKIHTNCIRGLAQSEVLRFAGYHVPEGRRASLRASHLLKWMHGDGYFWPNYG